jgi:hypothetical protein
MMWKDLLGRGGGSGGGLAERPEGVSVSTSQSPAIEKGPETVAISKAG